MDLEIDKNGEGCFPCLETDHKVTGSIIASKYPRWHSVTYKTYHNRCFRRSNLDVSLELGQTWCTSGPLERYSGKTFTRLTRFLSSISCAGNKSSPCPWSTLSLCCLSQIKVFFISKSLVICNHIQNVPEIVIQPVRMWFYT